MKYNYEIYQIKDIKNTNYAFRGLSEMITPKADDYKVVYNGEVEGSSSNVILEHLFYIFNMEHPKDFRGHSLSVSDIVKLDNTTYYCDSVGWEEIQFK